MKKNNALTFSLMILLFSPLMTGCTPKMLGSLVEGLSEPIAGNKLSVNKEDKKITKVKGNQNENFYFNRAYKKGEEGDHYGAISDYSKVIELNPRDAGSYYNRGLLKIKLKDYSGAVSDFSKAVEINPKDEKAYYNLGTLKGRYLEDYYGAISDFSKAIEINPRYHSAFKNRGSSKKFLGDMKGACSDWRKAVSLGNNNTGNLVRDYC